MPLSHPCSLHRSALEQLLVRAAQATVGAEDGRAREWEEIKVRVEGDRFGKRAGSEDRMMQMY